MKLSRWMTRRPRGTDRAPRTTDTFLQMRAREKHAEIIKWGCRFIGIHDAMMSTLATKVGSNI